MTPQLDIRTAAGRIILQVKVVPGSSRTAIAGELDGMLKVKISAPPEKGKANKMLAAFLAAKLDIKEKDVEIVSGQTRAVKQVSLPAQVGSEAIAALL